MSTPKSSRKARLALGRFSNLVLLVGLFVEPIPAHAGGYDVPIINTARYGGQGGTGISFVDGGTSLFINPAGMGRIGKGNIDVAATILDGRGQGTPTFLAPDINIQTERNPILFPFVSGGVRATKFFSIGVAAYIVGGAGGKYFYKVSATDEAPISDETKVLFQESTIGIAFNIDEVGLHIGAGYRITYGRVERRRPDPITALDLTLTGVNFEGFRAGFQWQPNEHIALGAVYRNDVTIGVSQDGGSALNNDFEYVSTDLIFPARAGAGFRFDWGSFGTAVDFEWIFNSQNGAVTFETRPELPVELQNVFDWSDQWLIRWGGEYTFFDGQWPVRLGFVYGSATTSPNFPNPFSPPPAPEYMFTLGTGYIHDAWQMNFAYARAFSSTVVDVDTSAFLSECPNCGGPGEYALQANHFVFDFSYNWR